MSEEPKKKLTLKDFPLVLRKVALVFAESQQELSFSEAARIAGVKPNTALQAYDRLKRKGIDFKDFLNHESLNHMWHNIKAVDSTVTKQSIKGSGLHTKLFYQRLGLLNEGIQVNVNTAIVATVPTPAQIPPDLAKAYPAELVAPTPFPTTAKAIPAKSEQSTKADKEDSED